MSIALLALLGLGILALTSDVFGSDDGDGSGEIASDDAEDDAPEDELPEEDPETDTPDDAEDDTPEEERDTGASVIEEDGVVTVELGEDETGTLAMVMYIDSEDAGIGLAEYHEARLYLVPEGAEIPTGENGDFDGSGLPLMFELDDLERSLELELLQSWDLGEVQPTNEEPYFTSSVVEPPEIRTEDPISYYSIDANTDGDDIVSIEETDGADTSPTVFVVRYTVDGATQELAASGGTFGGTDADEMIETEEGNITLRGGEGDDTISIHEGEAIGGPGDDVLENDPDGGETVLRGAAGVDHIFARDTDTQAHGGPGDDEIDLFGGAQGLGGDGDDRITLVDGAGLASGDAGDDTLVASAGTATPGAALMTGGDGADIFVLSPTDPSDAPASGGVTITDFDPTEDILQVENAEAILDVRITSDANADRVVVEVDVEAPGNDAGVRSETLTFVLTGSPAVTEDHIVLAA